MPVVGNRKTTQMGRGYAADPISEYASAFRDVASSILQESGVDLFMEPQKATMIGASNDTLRNFFVENSADRSSMTAEEYEDHIEMMNEQYNNDREALLEYAPTGSFNPVIGMTFPIHKNILMNNIFDKGAIPKVVAREPKFTISMETRILRKPDGTEIDMFKQQNEMMAAIDSTAPFHEIELILPENSTTDILGQIPYASADDDNLSIETHISAVKVNIYLATGDINPGTGVAAETDGMVAAWIPVNMRFVPAYGEYDRTLMDQFVYNGKDDSGAAYAYKGTLAGYMKNNRVTVLSTSTLGETELGAVLAVKLAARIDTSSAMLRTCSVAWRVRTDIVEIPSAIPINTPVSPEEVKDIGALYQVNQLSKIMSLFKTVLGNYKDDKIKTHLDTSFKTMPTTNKLAATFDFAPREGYYSDHIEWRHRTFMDALDTHVTNLLQVLNDPNMTISVIGRPDLIRKITPTEYTYQTPSSIGPVELDFVKTVTTSDKRVYQFIASDKLRGNNNLIVILCPRNTERIVYRIYDYQLYISNEIRNMANYALPAIHAFERWKFVEYQPVQGRIQILNPTGLRTKVENTDPIGSFSMNDFNSNDPYVAP